MASTGGASGRPGSPPRSCPAAPAARDCSSWSGRDGGAANRAKERPPRSEEDARLRSRTPGALTGASGAPRLHREPGAQAAPERAARRTGICAVGPDVGRSALSGPGKHTHGTGAPAPVKKGKGNPQIKESRVAQTAPRAPGPVGPTIDHRNDLEPAMDREDGGGPPRAPAKT
ncbi:hypothetical protein NDU88_008276 [Pleurodeles waltl]|uniref:Uncharacterized protein n=1 Tax=Pleurodeles waltl TaxID=8319 RepID=A0AAV7SV70_PLEWA|nr:hypothetical protein NDU88_008276 [Pleurodeles waltl]